MATLNVRFAPRARVVRRTKQAKVIRELRPAIIPLVHLR
jgi:hypothetical protein